MASQSPGSRVSSIGILVSAPIKNHLRIGGDSTIEGECHL
jgi:hypothetical protein